MTSRITHPLDSADRSVSSTDPLAVVEDGVYPVVVVGAGPVGLTAALTLSRNGIPCVVLEDDGGVCTGSRALGMSRRTLEIWSALGAADSILAHGRHWSSGRSFYKGKTIVEFTMPDDAALRHRPMFNIQQCHTEQYLVNAFLARPDTEVRWRHRVAGLEEHDGHVELQVETANGSYPLRARYVVACDGARSTIRGLLGLPLEGTSYEASYVIADIELASQAPMERRCWFDPPSNPGLTVLMHGQPDHIWRLDFQLAPHEDPQKESRPERVLKRIREHLEFIGEHGDWRLVWASPYRVHSRVLAHFRKGRIVFAGDAAHLMPIFGIRGLNSGVEDAWNLGWKLAGVLRNESPIEILDAYSAERRDVFFENTALANRNASFMTPANEGALLLRNAVLSLALGDTPVQDILNPKQATYVPLRSSPLIAREVDTWRGGPTPGEVLPDVRLTSTATPGATHLQSLVGARFCVVYFAANQSQEAVREGLEAIRVLGSFDLVLVTRDVKAVDPHAQVVYDLDGRLHAEFDAPVGAVYLIRPDHHVAGRWRRVCTEQIESAIALSRGIGMAVSRQHAASLSEVPMKSAERVYEALSEALTTVAPKDRLHFLLKLAVRQGLGKNDADALSEDIEAARAHLPGNSSIEKRYGDQTP